MAEIKNSVLAGLAVVLLLLSSGVTYMLKPTGSYRTCTSGWEFEGAGSYEGKYSCAARPDVYFDCVNVRDSSKTKGYYCDEATRVEVQTETEVVQGQCPAAKETLCPDFISYYDTGKTFCRRYNDGTQKCTDEVPY